MKLGKSNLLRMNICNPGRFQFVPLSAFRSTSACVAFEVASSALGKDIGVVGRWTNRHGLCRPSKIIAAFTSQISFSEMSEMGKQET